MRQQCHDSTVPALGLVVAGGSCWGVGRSGLSAASTCFSESSPDWEMKDDTLQSNCHHCIGYATNKWPPAWIIWWIMALTCPSGNYFCPLKNPADLKWVEIVHPFLISLPLQVEPKFYFLLSWKDEFPWGYCLPDCPDVPLAVRGDDFEKQLHGSIDAKCSSCGN